MAFSLRFSLFRQLCLLLIAASYAFCKVIPLESSTFDQTIENAQIAVVNFYANWCRFSQMLEPTFREASENFENNTNVIFGAVDCDQKSDLAHRFNVNKYPTLKYFRFGQLSKREYRGSRSVEALVSFVNDNLGQIFDNVDSREKFDSEYAKNKDKRSIFFYPAVENSPEATHMMKIASNLREDCKFYMLTGQDFKEKTLTGSKIVFRPPEGTESDEISLDGEMLQNFDFLKQWVTDKCIPLVRELTFTNAEELTEEGLPFLILFRKSDDKEILELFTQHVASELNDQKAYINVLHADGGKFAHPLHHLGKNTYDLPLIAIDSFTHMYLFPDIKKLSEPGALKQFVADLYSGKLHREFHHGPDAAPPAIPGQPAITPPGIPPTSPPSSIFKKLKPSQNRYTLLRDEL